MSALAERGMRVTLVDRVGDALDAATRAIEGATAHALNVADSDALVTPAEELGKAPTLLMNNAAIGAGGNVLAGVAAWRRLIDVNLMGVLHGVAAFAPAINPCFGPSLTAPQYGRYCPARPGPALPIPQWSPDNASTNSHGFSGGQRTRVRHEV